MKPPGKPKWVLSEVATGPRIVVAEAVVVVAAFGVVVPPGEADGLLQVLGVVLGPEVAPGVELGGPDDAVALVVECPQSAEVIGVVMVDADGGCASPLLRLAYQRVLT